MAKGVNPILYARTTRAAIRRSPIIRNDWARQRPSHFWLARVPSRSTSVKGPGIDHPGNGPAVR